MLQPRAGGDGYAVTIAVVREPDPYLKNPDYRGLIPTYDSYSEIGRTPRKYFVDDDSKQIILDGIGFQSLLF